MPRISTGDMFRAAVRSGSRWGKQAAAYMDAGELVPDDVVVGMVTERLGQDDVQKRGFVLDGFPRSVAQAEALDRIADPELVISLEVPTEMVLQRLAGRRTCEVCGTNYGPDNPPVDDSICDVCGGKVVVSGRTTPSRHQPPAGRCTRSRRPPWWPGTCPATAWPRSTAPAPPTTSPSASSGPSRPACDEPESMNPDR